MIADQAPTARNLVLGVIQLLFILAWALPAFLSLLAVAGRNLQHPRLRASVTADAQGILLRLPAVPFVLCPFQVLREESVPWEEADLSFTSGKRSRLLVSSARSGSAIPSGQFRKSLYEIDDRLRSAYEQVGQAQARIESDDAFTGTSPAALLFAGIACVVGFGIAIVWLMDTGIALANLLSIGAILGVGLIGMGVSPRKRLVIDRRGLFVERGRHLDFIPREILAEARTEYSTWLFGAFESGHVDARVGRSKLRIGFNRLLGLGFPVRDIMTALAGGRLSAARPGVVARGDIGDAATVASA